MYLFSPDPGETARSMGQSRSWRNLPHGNRAEQPSAHRHGSVRKGCQSRWQARPWPRGFPAAAADMRCLNCN